MKLVKIKKELFMYRWSQIYVKNCLGICSVSCKRCTQVNICNDSDYIIRKSHEID